MSTVIAAHIFTALAVIGACFMLALAAGMPWGMLTMGGKFPGRLPIYMRVIVIVQMFLILAFALVVLIRAGVVLPDSLPISRMLVWGVVAYNVLGVIVHIITPSRWERIVWLPVIVLLLISSVVVATS